MQIVIDIEEKRFRDIQRISTVQLKGRTPTLEQVIAHGRLLPKGHGDLIDRDDLLADSYCIDDWSGNEVNIVDVMTVKMADAIIEADKAESEGSK